MKESFNAEASRWRLIACCENQALLTRGVLRHGPVFPKKGCLKVAFSNAYPFLNGFLSIC